MLIIGAKGFASEVVDLLLRNGEYDIAMFDDVTPNPKHLTNKIPILKTEEEVISFFSRKSDYRFNIAVGGVKDREYLYRKFIRLEGVFTTLISDTAYISTVGTKIGEGANICAGAIITSNVVIGKGLLLISQLFR